MLTLSAGLNLKPKLWAQTGQEVSNDVLVGQMKQTSSCILFIDQQRALFDPLSDMYSISWLYASNRFLLKHNVHSANKTY